MKAKTYGINLLIISSLQLKIINHKQLATKKFIRYVLGFILIFLKVYKQGILSSYFSYFKTWASWDRPIKMT